MEMSPRPSPSSANARARSTRAAIGSSNSALLLLGEAGTYRGFTVDAVAKKADVAKATIYYQFESKTGLLEAVCDSLAETGGMSKLAAAFTNPDPVAALRLFVGTFGGFWDVDRAAMRRLRALAALDPEVGAVISARDDRRRTGLGVLVGRLLEEGDKARETGPEDLVRVLHVLTSFETFDALAKPDEPLTDVVDDVVGLAETVAVRMRAARGGGTGLTEPTSGSSREEPVVTGPLGNTRKSPEKDGRDPSPQVRDRQKGGC